MRTLAFAVAVVFLLLSAPGVAVSENASSAVDKVIVIKHARSLELLSHGKVVKQYKVALGTEPIGAKTRQGDHRTPEGSYVLDSRNSHSQFYKSLHISYPNAQERARAVSADVSPGGDIYVHGLPNGYGAIGAAHRLRDWTDGCIAVTDKEIDEIWELVKNGTPIEIRS
jgi:murein L,D-transpeptidase YafK